MQNAQAIIDLNITVQEQDKSIAAKDAQYVCIRILLSLFHSYILAEFMFWLENRLALFLIHISKPENH